MIQFLFLLLIVILLPGCHSLIKWGKKEIQQIDKINFDQTIVKKFLQTIIIYEQFSFLWACDILFISQNISDLFIDMYTKRQHSNNQEKEILKQKEDSEQQQKVTFIILLPHQIDFNEKNEWQIRLKIRDCIQKPNSITLIELSPEHKLFFGEKYKRFKLAYKVTFEKKQDFNTAHTISLIFSNTIVAFTSTFYMKKRI
jgi:hypothetical protein